MRLLFRTRAEKRRAYRRLAARVYRAMFVLTCLYGAAVLSAYLLGWL